MLVLYEVIILVKSYTNHLEKMTISTILVKRIDLTTNTNLRMEASLQATNGAMALLSVGGIT